MKKAIGLVLALALVLALTACVPADLTAAHLVGEWTGSWEWEGDKLQCNIRFSEDGTYTKWMYKNGSVYTREDGEYTIENNAVACKGGPAQRVIPGMTVIQTSPSVSSTTTYRYERGKLTNGTLVSLSKKK